MWECIVVGGGAAGLSAALVLGRARRRTLVVDAGAQSNLPAHAIGGLLGQRDRSPAELYALGHEQLAELPSVTVRAATVVGAQRTPEGFAFTLEDGDREVGERAILAVGASYLPPDLPGLAPLWGKSVFHCPFCHGWEVRERPLAALGPPEQIGHLALLLTMWSDDVVALTGGAAVGGDDRARLEAAGVVIDERPVASLEGEGGELHAVKFADGERLERAGLLVGTAMRARSELAVALGATTAGDGRPSGAIVVDAFQRTDVPGLFSVGDVSAPLQQVSLAISQGASAGAFVVGSLLAARHGLPEL